MTKHGIIFVVRQKRFGEGTNAVAYLFGPTGGWLISPKDLSGSSRLSSGTWWRMYSRIPVSSRL